MNLMFETTVVETNLIGWLVIKRLSDGSIVCLAKGISRSRNILKRAEMLLQICNLCFLGFNWFYESLMVFFLLVGEFDQTIATIHLQLSNLLLQLSAITVQFLQNSYRV